MEKTSFEPLPIHKNILDKLDYFHKSNKIPHIIFHGSSGTGKRTIVDQFLNKIYNNEKHKIKSNVMFVNCAHGKGIKFIREELKFFAKTNIQSNNGIIFKSIVLLNADFLTIDAQSALRRCIELFSYNTRFFIIVENKNKLLNPILSRFCEIYVPENIENGEVINLHQKYIRRNYNLKYKEDFVQWIDAKINEIDLGAATHANFTALSGEIYEHGLSCLDLMEWLKHTDLFNNLEKSAAYMCFDKIKAEFRNEKLLMFYMFDFLFLRSTKDLKCILTI
jgi:DNA polymerase III delta prime subunit